MSIAASVVVQPSRLLLGLVVTLCIGVFGLGAILAAGLIPDLSIVARVLWALCCTVCAAFGFRSAWRQRRIYHLDISGTGQIRLRCESLGQGGLSGNMPPMSEKSADDGGILVTLQADSTIWPGFLMLRLKATDGHLYNIPILPDSLPQDAFRAVTVACRWIAAHDFKP
jgi:hypothetical protein